MRCYSNDGLSMTTVRHDYVAQEGEVLFPDLATDEQLAAAFPQYTTKKRRHGIIKELAALELQQTPRMIREAALGIDDGRLATLNEEIEELRQQLYS